MTKIDNPFEEYYQLLVRWDNFLSGKNFKAMAHLSTSSWRYPEVIQPLWKLLQGIIESKEKEKLRRNMHLISSKRIFHFYCHWGRMWAQRNKNRRRRKNSTNSTALKTVDRKIKELHNKWNKVLHYEVKNFSCALQRKTWTIAIS